jgi:cold shock CspA family protein
MDGTMLWFNVEKGYGLICTEDEERLEVGRSAFLVGHEPEPRCGGREVSFDREADDDGARAVNVCFVVRAEPRRARLRYARGGRSV